MNKKTVKKTFEQFLQYGWMLGHPKHIDKDGWDNLKEFYKTELNNGKDFKPDETNKASAWNT